VPPGEGPIANQMRRVHAERWQPSVFSGIR
jgi:hypothetical protein